MLRYDRVSPLSCLGLADGWGRCVLQFFLGRLSGQQFVHVGSQTLGRPGVALNNQPFINGQKVSFKPSPNLEFSVSRTHNLRGRGRWLSRQRVFCAAYFPPATPPGPNDPGDRRSDVDVQYTIPKSHNLLKLYVDTFTDDELFPLAYPTHSAWSPGFYFARLPHLPHIDFRAEGYLTPRRTFPGFYYFNVHYLSGYTNDRQLLGSWIGRESNGYQLWGHWWLSPRSSVRSARAIKRPVMSFFVVVLVRDVNISTDVALGPHWQLGAAVQQERWRFPLLSATAKKQFDYDDPALIPPESRRILMATAEIISTKAQPMANWVRNANLLWDHRRLLAKVAAVALILSAAIAFLTPKRYESVARLMPPEQPSSGAAMLAALAGHSLGGLAGFGNLAGYWGEELRVLCSSIFCIAAPSVTTSLIASTCNTFTRSAIASTPLNIWPAIQPWWMTRRVGSSPLPSAILTRGARRQSRRHISRS